MTSQGLYSSLAQSHLKLNRIDERRMSMNIRVCCILFREEVPNPWAVDWNWTKEEKCNTENTVFAFGRPSVDVLLWVDSHLHTSSQHISLFKKMRRPRGRPLQTFIKGQGALPTMKPINTTWKSCNCSCGILFSTF